MCGSLVAPTIFSLIHSHTHLSLMDSCVCCVPLVAFTTHPTLHIRRLIPGLHPATNQTPLGGAEAAAQACELDSLCPAMPLDVFRVYDADEVSQVWLYVCVGGEACGIWAQ